MPFVKLDCGIIDSSLWVDHDARNIFITGLLMAIPYELQAPMDQLEVRAIKNTGFIVPPGWYGFVPAAGVGIVRRSGLDQETGLAALARLGDIDRDSRSKDYDGRRMVRVDGGYIILNYDKYRNRDYTAAERSRRWRIRKAAGIVTRVGVNDTRNVTQAEDRSRREKTEAVKKPLSANAAEEGFEALWGLYLKKVGKGAARKAYINAKRAGKLPDLSMLAAKVTGLQETEAWSKDGRQYQPHLATWLNREGWNDEPQSAAPKTPWKAAEAGEKIRGYSSGAQKDQGAVSGRTICGRCGGFKQTWDEKFEALVPCPACLGTGVEK